MDLHASRRIDALKHSEYFAWDSFLTYMHRVELTH